MGTNQKGRVLHLVHGIGGDGEHIYTASSGKNQSFFVGMKRWPYYRLSPKVKSPVYLEDAAASVAWTHGNIGKHKGDPSKIFISGHSAGGYLSAMLGLDSRWLDKHKIPLNKIAGVTPVAGQMITHSTIREERGIRAAHL